MKYWIQVEKENESFNEKVPFGISMAEKLEKNNFLIFSSKYFSLSERQQALLEKCDETIEFSKQKKKLYQRPLWALNNPLKSSLNELRENIERFFFNNFPFYEKKAQLFSAKYFPKSSKSFFLDLLSPFNKNGERLLCLLINIDSKISIEMKVFQKSLEVAATQLFRRKTYKGADLLSFRITKRIFSPFILSRYHQILKKIHEKTDESNYKTYFLCPSDSALFFSDSSRHLLTSSGSFLLIYFSLPRYSLLNPENAPLSIFERLTNNIIQAPKEMKL